MKWFRRAAVEVAKELQGGKQIVVLQTGIRAEIRTVAASLIEAVVSRIKDPDIPVEWREDKQRNEQNPSNRAYLKAVQDVREQRASAAIDAMVLFGVILLDPVPPDEDWLPKLQFLEKHNHLDLSEFDMNDPMDKEFIYKRYITIGSGDLALVSAKAGMTREAMARAEENFRRQSERNPDPGSAGEGKP